jgi:hypothetical protein
MPTSVTILTVLGLVMQMPVIVLAVVLILAGLQKGAHAGNAGLALAIPFAIAAVIALIGAVMTLGTGAWSLTSEVGQAAGWGWVRWSSVVVIVIWIIGLLAMMG